MIEDFELSEFLPYQLAVASARVSRAFSERYRDRFGISIPEWRVLAHLVQAGTVSVREIHAQVDMDKSKVSRAATRLEAAGLITKRSHSVDRRLVEMELTEKGRTLVVQIIREARTFQHDIENRLGTDAVALRRALRRLLEE